MPTIEDMARTAVRWTVLVLLAAASAAGGEVKVLILSSRHLRRATVSAEGRTDTLLCSGDTLYVNGAQHGRYLVSSDGFTLGFDAKSRKYAGSLEAWAQDGELRLVNRVPEEAYLASVAGAEMVPGAGLEALKAQAVLCRTLLYRGARHPGKPWEFCDLTHCQSYRGAETATPAARRAVRETAGLVLVYQGELCMVYYHSTSGGRTADATSIWPDVSAPYLRSVPDEACSASPHYRWECVLRASDIARALDMPHVSKVMILDRKPDGRTGRIALKGSETRVYEGWNFRMLVCQALGWNTLKSSWFSVEQDAGAFVFKGRGLGHGVGLSQWGAAGMAQQGADFRTILAHYFPGAEVSRWR